MAGISTIGIFVSVGELSANTNEVNRLDIIRIESRKKANTEPDIMGSDHLRKIRYVHYLGRSE